MDENKHPSNGESLGILREIALAGLPVKLDDIDVRNSLNGGRAVCVYRKSGEFLVEDCPIEKAVYLARQKLAAERAEAAKSEREKRLEAALKEIIKNHVELGICRAATIARKALES